MSYFDDYEEENILNDKFEEVFGEAFYDDEESFDTELKLCDEDEEHYDEDKWYEQDMNEDDETENK